MIDGHLTDLFLPRNSTPISPCLRREPEWAIGYGSNDAHGVARAASKVRRPLINKDTELKFCRVGEKRSES
jgi:hypothetical protein